MELNFLRKFFISPKNFGENVPSKFPSKSLILGYTPTRKSNSAKERIEIDSFSRDTSESETITADKTPLETAVEENCF